MTRCIDCRDREAVTRVGRCTRCHNRYRKGLPRLVSLRQVGEPDGHGLYGILDVDEDTVLCHECGRRMQRLGRHLVVHGMTIAEYREAHGLPRKLALPRWRTGARCPSRCGHGSGRQRGSIWWRRGADGQAEPGQRAASTDPGVSMVRCRVHRAEGQLRRGRVRAPGEGRGPARPPRPRPLTDEQRTALLEVDGEARDAMVRELQADGVSSRSLGAVLGLLDWQMSDHYPRGGSPD